MAYQLFYHPNVVSDDIPEIPRNLRERIRKAIEDRLLVDPIKYGDKNLVYGNKAFEDTVEIVFNGSVVLPFDICLSDMSAIQYGVDPAPGIHPKYGDPYKYGGVVCYHAGDTVNFDNYRWK